MRTITVTYLDGTPDLVFDAESWDHDADDMFVFRADGRCVALVPSRNVRHIVSEPVPDTSGRVYDASVVSAKAIAVPHCQKVVLSTPADPREWVLSGSDLRAAKAFAVDAARDLGFATVGEVQMGLTRTDVASGRTTRTWTAEVTA